MCSDLRCRARTPSENRRSNRPGLGRPPRDRSAARQVYEGSARSPRSVGMARSPAGMWETPSCQSGVACRSGRVHHLVVGRVVDRLMMSKIGPPVLSRRPRWTAIGACRTAAADRSSRRRTTSPRRMQTISPDDILGDGIDIAGILGSSRRTTGSSGGKASNRSSKAVPPQRRQNWSRGFRV
jgi:hypothetical protein